MTTTDIKKLVKLLGFDPTNKNEDVWIKKYPKHDNYTLALDFDKESIDYGLNIEKGDDTTSNFSSDENFVVLECVNHLLEKGYKPKSLTLEKRWRTDKKTAGIGKSDITITDLSGKTLIIIECKTWGKEYIEQKERVIANGGQLFQYYKQDTNCKFLSLYASCVQFDKIEVVHDLIQTFDTEQEKAKQQETDKLITFELARNVEELLEVWKNKSKKEFHTTGIFEDEIEPYNPGFVPIRIKDLKEFTQENARAEYNKFEEILRHNNISDRSNAFNRFISLVLAKIVDEEKPADAITEFQNKKGIDTSEELLERLQSLYSKAMKDYLDEIVINYTIEDIEKIISHYPRQTSKDDLKRIYKELKFYSNNEFSFKEVYNKELFEQNAKVLYEVVERLQQFKFKYSSKAQFLGDFFEDMLESGFKQSEGQFFTPTPIAKFMVSSMPIMEVIEEKVKNKEAKILPSVIDYACGSGHFITEAIEEIQNIIKSLDENYHKDIPTYKQSTKWAGEYICGIEKDYRLARTSQVACFMHGDGDAKIIFGDGLEEHDKMPIKQFDVLLANPPYTIKDFKKHLNKDKIARFELLPFISEDSDDIEVLFIERTKQLVKIGGFAGVFLPSSILNNEGLYTKAREIILKYFELKAIVEFGNNTFSATGTKTVVLFMKRRNDDFQQNCIYIAEDLVLGKDVERKDDFADTQKLLSDYCDLLAIPLSDYKTLVDGNPNNEIIETEYYQNYKEWFEDRTDVKNWKKGKPYEKLTKEQREKQESDWFFEEVLEIEKEKFLYFLLTHKLIETETKGTKKTQKQFVPQQTLIVKSGQKDIEKAFLGYTFSDRRGYKGLEMRKDANGKEITKLYDKEDIRNPEKVNTYIWKAFQEIPISEISPGLQEHIAIYNLADCFDFEKIDFEKRININSEAKIDWTTVWGTEKLKTLNEIAEIQKGTSITKEQTKKGKIPVVAGGQQPAYYHNIANRTPNIITVSASGAYAGFVNYWDIEVFASDCSTIISNNEKSISTKLIYEYLKVIQDNIYKLQRGQAQPHVYPDDLQKIKVPFPSPKTQNIINAQIFEIEKTNLKYNKEIEKAQQNIAVLINQVTGPLTKLKDMTTKIGSGATPKGGENSYQSSGVRLIRSQNIYDFGFFEKGEVFINEEQASKLDNVIVEKNDVLFNITGASIARCCIIDEKYLPARVNQHVAIIRTNENANPKYVQIVLTSADFKKKLLKIGKGATSRESITKKQLEDFTIPLPNKKEQDKIVKEIEVFEAVIKKSETELQNSAIKKADILKRNLT